MMDLPLPESESFAIVYDWHLDIRAGGPTGYIANLKLGVEGQGLSSVEFITRQTPKRQPKVVSQLYAEGTELVSLHEDSVTRSESLAEVDGRNLLYSLENLHQARFSSEIEQAVLPGASGALRGHDDDGRRLPAADIAALFFRGFQRDEQALSQSAMPMTKPARTTDNLALGMRDSFLERHASDYIGRVVR